MRVLFLGGTGNISSACVQRALTKGHDVTILVRGNRPSPFGDRVKQITGDRNDPTILQDAARRHFDVVANFLGFTPDQIERDVNAFSGHLGQYVFVSSASVYHKPIQNYPITESTPLHNPYWEYSRHKIACEERLLRAYREQGFPVTIVRPAYTYGRTWIPAGVGGHGYTVLGRMRAGKPVISHGDGQSLWVLTTSEDLAIGFVGLFGRVQAIGEAFHITSDQVLTWDVIYRTIARVAGCEANIVHIPAEFIATMYPQLGPSLLGDKSYSVIFDNSKIRRLVPKFCACTPFAEGVARSIAWHDEDATRQVIDHRLSEMMDHLIKSYHVCLSNLRPPLQKEPRWV